MSEQVNKEQTKGAEQENSTELTDQQLAEAQGGAATQVQADERRNAHAMSHQTNTITLQLAVLDPTE